MAMQGRHGAQNSAPAHAFPSLDALPVLLAGHGGIPSSSKKLPEGDVLIQMERSGMPITGIALSG